MIRRARRVRKERRTSCFAFFVLFVFFVAGCGSESTPTSPDAASAPTTVLFTWTLGVHESSFYSFTVAETETVRLTLSCITGTSRATALGTALGFGLGIPAGTGCAMTSEITTDARLTAQIVETHVPGIYCVNVFDAGNLDGPVQFAVRINHP